MTARPSPCFESQTCPDCDGVGEVPDAHFFCRACDGRGSVPARLWCYEVESPDHGDYSMVGTAYDPPEPKIAWRVFVAPSATAAIALAVKHPDFNDWVVEMRGDGSPPFKGLRAKLARCLHGVCWGCDGNEDGCINCLAMAEPEAFR